MGGDYLGELAIDGWILFECVIRKWDVWGWTRFIWLKTESRGG
jgi:hypothetical protein